MGVRKETDHVTEIETGRIAKENCVVRVPVVGICLIYWRLHKCRYKWVFMHVSHYCI